MFATMRHTKLHHASHFLTKAHAAGAMNAPAHFLHRNQGTDILDRHNPFLFLIARRRGTVTDRQILQLALSALVTNRTIERMIDQQKLHHRLLRLDSLFTLGANDHALRYGRGARWHGLGHFFHIHQAHTATRSNAELLVIAKMGDIGASLVSGMHDHAAFNNVHFFAVEFDFNHVSVLTQTLSQT